MRSSSILVPDSPEEHAPSTWQARFGKRKSSQSTGNTRERQRHSQLQGSESPSIADQLLSALNAREKQKRHLKPEEELSWQCADELLGGKRNAFIPELRVNQFLGRDGRNGDSAGPQTASDSVADAQEIIKRRFQVESQAEALRRHKSKTETVKAHEALVKISYSSGTADAKAQRKSVSDRAKGPQHTKSKLFELDELSKATAHGLKKAGAGPERIVSRREAILGSRDQSTCSNSNGREIRGRPGAARVPQDRSRAHSTTVSSDPLKKMEERQQCLREMKAARAAKQHEIPATVSNNTERQRPLTTNAGNRSNSNSNQDDGDDVDCVNRGRSAACSTRDERVLQEKIERLASENQRAIEVQEQQRIKQHVLKFKARTLAFWKRQSDVRKLQEAYAKQVFEWRLLQSVWRNWKRYAQSVTVKRVEMETRARLVHEKQVVAQAEAFVRQKQLPKWFFRWFASVRAHREAKELEVAQQKRKEQTQRLVERLIRNQTRQVSHGDVGEELKLQVNNPEVIGLDSETQAKSEAKPVVRSGYTKKLMATAISASQQPKTRVPHPKAAWNVEEPPASSPSSSPQPTSSSPTLSSQSNARTAKTHLPVDPLYVSMQERAAERKQRRDLLKQKYEQLELEKKEATAMHLAERDAQLLQQKLDERERIRERKRQEALAAQEKMQRIEALDAQRRQAKQHDYKRLVFYYGFKPLKRQWELSKRVAANASEWHQLHVLHINWQNWLKFVHQRQIERRQVERQKLVVAAKHYALTLKRQSFQRFKWLHQRILSTELAIQRQRQWNLMKRSWSYWQHAFTVSCVQQQAQQREVEARLNESRLRRVWLQWRVQTAELREERELQQEKQRMWAKVRGWLNE